MKLCKTIFTCALCCAFLPSLLSGCVPVDLNKTAADPVAIFVWHYYNGVQQQMFDTLVEEFNETVGASSGIVVESRSYGKINDLTEKVLDAINKVVGAAEVPDVFAAYADTAYKINQAGMVAEISQYLTEEECNQYISSYLEEGRFDGEGFKIFPVAKSTEVLTLNKTEWTQFAAATGAAEADLSSWTGLAGVAENYYRWTDGLTPDVKEDGKAFFGRDAFANYIIIGSYQLGTELFAVVDGKVKLQVDKDIMRTLWDNFYVPYINGYYASYGKFRSDDLRTGDIAAFVGATSGATYFPEEVTRADGTTTPIEGAVYAVPNFTGTPPKAVQQGAGMVVTRSDETRERAAIAFLKWFTQAEQNVRFAISSGYLPVTYAANTREAVAAASIKNGQTLPPVLEESLNLGVDTAWANTLYTSRPFENGSETRKVVENSMQDKAKADRAQVQTLIAAGMSRADAVAQFDTDACFNSWYHDFYAALTAVVAGGR